MKYKLSLIAISLAVTALLTLSSCSDDPAASEQYGTVAVRSELTTAAVSSAFRKDGSITAGPTCDSVLISRVRFVFSDMKMHLDGADSSDDKGVVQTGPFIMDYRPGMIIHNDSASIPVGTYDRIKYEIHKLKDGEDDAAIADPDFADFVKDGARYTYIIEGVIYNGNNASAFTFYSSKNENLNLSFDIPITVIDGGYAPVTLQFDPTMIFKQGSKPLDPRYEENRNDIEKMVKDAFHALKK
jgi:hypothetical protein